MVMNNRIIWIVMMIQLYCSVAFTQKQILPKPNKHQLAWHEMEFYLFVHFGPNTFTGLEWGHGDEAEAIFNPTQLDCNQWARTAKASGAKGIIITAKHHDGFCLWPSQYSKHTVRESIWKNGQGDVLKELSEACKSHGLKFGVYISPWDRNHPEYGTPKYNDIYINTMKEIFDRYSPIWELWWDGANGEGPNGKKQVYDFALFEREMRKISPSTVIFSDIGPDIRWIGNERGIVGDPNWNYLDTTGFKRGHGAPHVDTLNHGNYNGRHWIPGECDVSIRPGWFYHKEEDDRVKSAEQLFNLYLKSVGRGANLLLNVPPDPRGLIHTTDSTALIQFKKLIDQSFAQNLLQTSMVKMDGDRKTRAAFLNYSSFLQKAKRVNSNMPTLRFELKKEAFINCLVLQETIIDGQFIRSFKVELYHSGVLIKTVEGSSIGRKRILTFPGEQVDQVKIICSGTSDQMNLQNVAAYHIAEQLLEKK